MTTASGLERKSLDDPEEVRTFAGHGYANASTIGDGQVLRGHFQPGWRWSQDVKPIAGTDSCQAAHVGYVISGRMRIRMDDGTEAEFGPGDLMECAPGHDAWILGDQECVVLDWGPSAAKYAKG
ncbi:MAG TPA: cupin domain-containing protein [Anaerolineales bacterium]|nr:cupin domain-containing protein [Anaerolineales bacterium]